MAANLLFGVLAETELRRMAPYCETVAMHQHATLCTPDEQIAYAYFPISGVYSTLVHASSGEVVEVALVGREGMVGVPLVLGEETTPFQVIVQMPGSAIRIAREPFVTYALEAGHGFCGALLKYANLFLATVAQTAVCNRVHRIEQRLARWLLDMHDRAGTDTLLLTHEVLGLMLGAYRPSITNALKALQERELLRVGRGRIVIANQAALEKQACECHEVIRRRTAATLAEIRRLAA